MQKIKDGEQSARSSSSCRRLFLCFRGLFFGFLPIAGVQVDEGVLLRVLKIFTCVRAQNLDFLFRVAEGVREDVEGEGFEPFGTL